MKKLFTLLVVVFLLATIITNVNSQDKSLLESKQKNESPVFTENFNQVKLPIPVQDQPKFNGSTGEIDASFMYAFASTSGTYTAISGGTTIIAAATDDGVSALTSIGFNFTYNGTVFTTFGASSNGFITLGAIPSSTNYGPISSASNSIAFCARDGKTNGAVTYLLSGSAPNRVLTIQYPAWYLTYSGTTNYVDAQIKLYETTNVIQIVYGTSARATSYTSQVGMTGPSYYDFSNRTTTANWAATTAGTSNTATMTWSTTVYPATGQTYTWTPSAYVTTFIGNITPNSTAVQTSAYLSATIPYWSFNATAGTIYGFSLCSNTEDSYLRIYSASTISSSADDNGPYCSGVPASITWTCPTTGTYYVVASHYSYSNFTYAGSLAYCIASPTVTTTTASAITSNSATSGGNATWAGGLSITARGVCWNTTGNPTTANSKTSDGTGTGTFTSSITGLTAGTLYYYRAYATNSAGTSYGSVLTFTTATTGPPTVTTTTPTAITTTTATSGGNVTFDGGASVTARGVCWNTTANPVVTDAHTTDGTGTGTFTSSITGLTASTTYHVRAYATNSYGTSYGTDLSFTTQMNPITSFPWTEPFTTWPPSNFTLTGGTQNWAQYISTNNSAFCNFWGWTNPNNALLITPPLNFGALTNPRLTFKWSHQYMSSYPLDELKVSLTTNDGSTWTVLWDYAGATLNSNDGAGTTTPGTFVSSGDINLNSYKASVVKIKIDGISGYGPDVFVDDVTVDETPANPIFSITPASKTFPNINLGGGSYDQIFTFSNIGGSALTVNPGSIYISGANANQFLLIDNNSYPISLNNSQSASIYVQFTPTSVGAKSANLHIDDNTGSHDIPLNGTGILNAPQSLIGGLNGAIPSLSWQVPAPESEIKLDDGTAEQNMWVGSPSTTNQMFYDKFVSPHDGTISQIAVYAYGGSAGLQFTSVMICPDDGTGKPNIANPWASFSNVSVATSISWIFLTLPSPQSVTIGQTFYIVTQWPAGSTTGPYVGTDNTSPAGRSAWTQDGGVTWNAWNANFIMRAYMGTYTDKLISGDVSPMSKELPIKTTLIIKDKNNKTALSGTEKVISVPTANITTNSGNKIFSSYTLYRGDATGVYNVNFPGLTATTCDDNTAVMGNTYYYAVQAVYTDGTSGYSNEVSVTAINPNFGTFSSNLYKFSNSTSFGNPAPGEKPSFEWIPTNDFTSISTWTSGSDDDGYFLLNFPGQYFKFFGTDYSAVYIGTNGYITFGTGSTAYSPVMLPSASAPFNMIAAAFKDLYVRRTYSPASNISYKINPDNIVISYENIYDISGGTGTNYISFQITLYTSTVSPTINSLFIINYNDDMSAVPLSSNYIVTGASVGVNNGTGSSGYNYRYAGTKAPMFNGVGKSAAALALGMVDYTSGTLPVKLASFSNTVSGRDITLNWITETEINNAGFEVYRKNEKDNFWTKVSYINGKGNRQTPTSYRYTDTKLNSGKYEYKLKQIDINGNYIFFILNGIAEIGIPSKFNLSQNYPNPFNPVTKIDFDLPFDSKVMLVVYDMLGREIKTLVSGELKTAGYYTVELNAMNLSSGTYFYRMIANSRNKDYIFTKKMLIIK